MLSGEPAQPAGSVRETRAGTAIHASGRPAFDVSDPTGRAQGQPAAALAAWAEPGTPGPLTSPHPDDDWRPDSGTPAGEPSGQPRRGTRRGPSYRDVFAIGEFRALWAAQVLSYAGDQFAQVAIAILVYGRTRSPLLTALAYALTYLPPILGGPLLSSLADLFPRRRVMIAADIIRAVLVAGMVLPSLPFPALCALLFLTVLLGPPFSAARSALLPDVVPPARFALASAVGNITFQVSQLAGFLAGAALVAAVGPHRALAADSVSFCLSAVIVAAWVRPRQAPGRWTGPRPSVWWLTRDGAVFVFSHPALRTLVLFGWLAGFAVIPEGLAAPYAHALGGGPFTVGLLMAAIPAGTIAGAFVIGRLAAPATRVRLIGWLAMLSCAPLMASLAHPPLWLLLPLWMLAGVGGAYQLAAVTAFVNALPADARGRAFGIAQSGLLAAQGLGILLAGAAAQLIGPEAVVAIGGLLGMTAAATLASAWSCQYGEVLAGGAAAGAAPPAGGGHPGRHSHRGRAEGGV
jgi:MFS family permease